MVKYCSKLVGKTTQYAVKDLSHLQSTGSQPVNINGRGNLGDWSLITLVIKRVSIVVVLLSSKLNFWCGSVVCFTCLVNFCSVRVRPVVEFYVVLSRLLSPQKHETKHVGHKFQKRMPSRKIQVQHNSFKPTHQLKSRRVDRSKFNDWVWHHSIAQFRLWKRDTKSTLDAARARSRVSRWWKSWGTSIKAYRQQRHIKIAGVARLGTVQ